MPRVSQAGAATAEASTITPMAAAAAEQQPAVQARPAAQPAKRKARGSNPRARRQQASRPATLRSPMIEPMEQKIGQDHPRVMKSTGPASESLEPALIQVVDRPVDPEKIAMLAFMEELVEVHIHTTSDKEADQVFEIFNNGQREVFKRGEVKTVKRKFVNELAMRKVTTYAQVEKLDESGTRTYVNVPSTALRYPFSVVRDDHPRGADWLKYALAAP